MSKPWETLRAELQSLSEDERLCAEIDRAVDAQLADPAFRPAELPPDPDPFDMNWEWAEPEPVAAATAPRAEPAAAPVAPPRRARSSLLRDLAYAGGFAVAATLLVAIGFFAAGRGGGREVALAGRVQVRDDVVRGPGTVDSVVVENTTDAQAFVTVVGLFPQPRRPAFHYLSEGGDIAIGPKASLTLANLPADFTGSTVALVVLTHTPAGDVVRRLLSDPRTAADAETTRAVLLRELPRMGYRGTGVEVAQFGR